MAGQAKLSDLKNRYAVVSADTQTQINWTYHITTTSTMTLPNTVSLSTGAWVKFTKQLNVSPTIRRFGSSVNIRTSVGVDNSIIFDIPSEIIFIWNGVEWEV